jgi:hypothetical protein
MSHVLCNPVAANLVERPEQWPGLTTFRQNAGFDEPNPLPLTVPPCWADLCAGEIEQRFVEPSSRQCESTLRAVDGRSWVPGA